MGLSLTPYLVMDGNANEAIEFYKKALHAEVLFYQKFGDMAENGQSKLPADVQERCLHASVKIGESYLLFSDTFPGNPHSIGNQVTICVNTNDKEESKRIYDALQEDGEVVMPLQETFFSPLYAIVTDKFGVTFQIYTEGEK